MNPRDIGRHYHAPVPLKDILRDLGIDKGHPDRDCPITKDEIMDLTILLNTTKSVTEFLKEV